MEVILNIPCDDSRLWTVRRQSLALRLKLLAAGVTNARVIQTTRNREKITCATDESSAMAISSLSFGVLTVTLMIVALAAAFSSVFVSTAGSVPLLRHLYSSFTSLHHRTNKQRGKALQTPIVPQRPLAAWSVIDLPYFSHCMKLIKVRGYWHFMCDN